jgi:parallel beta-helix repeat protein
LATLAVVIAAPLLMAATSSKTQKLTTVTCGETVTTSVVLAGDLRCSPGQLGLVIGASGITINLNGHTISQSGDAFGVYDSGYKGVTVENGTIRNFGIGLHLDSADGSHLQNLHMAYNSNLGVEIVRSSNVIVTGNYAISNTNTGISVSFGAGDQLIGNWVEENGGDGIATPAGDAGYVISQNKALDNGNNGITVQANSAQVSSNVANGNKNEGIDTASSQAAVTLNGNRASFNGALGINAAAGQKDGGGNVVQDNTSAIQCKNVVCAEVSN